MALWSSKAVQAKTERERFTGHVTNVVACSRVVDTPPCARDAHRTTHPPRVGQTELAGQRLRVTSSVEQQVVQVWIGTSFAEEQASRVRQLVFEGLRRRQTGQTDEHHTGEHHVLRLHRLGAARWNRAQRGVVKAVQQVWLLSVHQANT